MNNKNIINQKLKGKFKLTNDVYATVEKTINKFHGKTYWSFHLFRIENKTFFNTIFAIINHTEGGNMPDICNIGFRNNKFDANILKILMPFIKNKLPNGINAALVTDFSRDSLYSGLCKSLMATGFKPRIDINLSNPSYIVYTYNFDVNNA